MPNRILKESICSSETLDQLSAFEETVFYRLLVNCDDFGRLDARPKILIAKLFPLKDMRTKQMEDALRALTSAELVIPYEVNGKPFLQMKTWDRHQTQRTQKGKYPAIDGKLDTPVADNIRMIAETSGCTQTQADEIRCTQMHADARRCRDESESEYNPYTETESESETESNAHARAREDVQTQKERDFDRFWSAYPKKVGKGDARKAFAKIKDVAVETMIDAIEQQKQSNQWRRDGGQYIPNPATWLNREDWTAQLQADTLPPLPPPRQTTNPFLELLQEEGEEAPAHDQN